MNMKMNTPSQSSMFMALLLLLAVVLACSSSIGNETAKANKLVDEGNAAVQEAKKFVTEAEEQERLDAAHQREAIGRGANAGKRICSCIRQGRGEVQRSGKEV